jgi:CRISPR-associated protein Csy2
MSPCPSFDRLLVLPHLRVQNANAISSPLTHGFPSMTAFLGLMWALQRRTRALGLDLSFQAVGVVCHDYEEQISERGFVRRFRLTRNPVDKDGSTAAIAEEGRIHLELSLVFAVCCERWDREPDRVEADLATIAELVAGMRIAGGSLVPSLRTSLGRRRPYLIDLAGTEDDQRTVFRHARYRLLPGFALVARDDLLETRLTGLRQQDPTASPLDAWLSLVRIDWRHEPAADAAGGKGEWRNDRRGRGWVVPVPVGYGALGGVQSAGTVTNARDATTPFRFVESLYSVGEWISPHRITSPEQFLWYAVSRPDDGLYRCRNDYRPMQDPSASALEYDFD